jgi:hypothetical protein
MQKLIPAIKLLCLLGLFGSAQAQTPWTQTYPNTTWRATGTGQTTGHVVTLVVRNAAPTPIRSQIGPFFIPGDDYQSYVITGTYSLEAEPYSVATIELQGYCTHVFNLPVPAGAGATDPSSWIDGGAASPAPLPGIALAASDGFRARPPTDSGMITATYPGTTEPFPYLVSLNAHPESVAGMLIHAAQALELAFDRLVQSGRLPAQRREELVQQSFWLYTSMLEGTGYNRMLFSRQLTEEAEQAVGQPLNNESSEEVEQMAASFWSSVQLVGTEAKIIHCEGSPASDDLKLPAPNIPGSHNTGPDADAYTPAEGLGTWIRNRMAWLVPDVSDYPGRLLLLRDLLRSRPVGVDNPEELHQDIEQHLLRYGQTQVSDTEPTTEGALQTFLGVLHGIQTGDLSTSLRPELIRQLRKYVVNRSSSLEVSNPGFLLEWRRLELLREQSWYSELIDLSTRHQIESRQQALLQEWESAAQPASRAIPWQQVQLHGDQWKAIFPYTPAFVARKRLHPIVWGGIIGIPVGGTITYLILRDREEGDDDIPPPSITCPEQLTVECGSDTSPATTGSATAMDGLGELITPQFADELSGTPCEQVLTRTWTATDQAGQSVSCMQQITIVDTTPPNVTCPGNTTVSCDEEPDPTLTGSATATDFCSSAAEISIQFEDQLNGTQLLRTWMATDACGLSSSCVQEIELTDTESPSIQCPENQVIPCGSDTEPAGLGFAEASDNCDPNPAIDYQDELGDPGCEQLLTRTWAATDNEGNTSSCMQLITLVDIEAPTILCPPNITVLCGNQDELSITGTPVVEDNCTSTTYSFTDNLDGFSNCEGIILRLFEAVDECGNTVSCEQVIEVESVPCDLFVGSAVGMPDCGLANGSINLSVFPPGTYTIQWSNGLLGPSITGIPMGTYTATVTEPSTGCVEIVSVALFENSPNYIQNVQVVPELCMAFGNILLQLSSPSGGSLQVSIAGPVNLTIPGVPQGLVSLADYTILPVGNYTISVIAPDISLFCTDIVEVFLPYSPPFMLSVVSVVQPSAPGASNGSITLNLSGPGITFPLAVVVNDNLVGFANTPTFLLTNVPAGTYNILVYDGGGEGCPSNTVTVVLQDPPGAPEWSLSTGGAVFSWRYTWPGNWQLLWRGAIQPAWRPAIVPEGPSGVWHSPWAQELGLRKYSAPARWAAFAGVALRHDSGILGNTAWAAFPNAGLRYQMGPGWSLELDALWPMGELWRNAQLRLEIVRSF